MLESDFAYIFSQEITLSQAKLVQFFPAIVGFSTDKIYILKDIKYLVCAIAVVSGVLDGMNMVHVPQKEYVFISIYHMKYMKHKIH